MRYLVTGACGFTGSHIVDVLVEKGREVIATDIPAANRRWLRADVKFVASDVTDIYSLRQVMDGVDIVLHPAAIFDFTAPADLLERVNVQGTENLCRVALESDVKRFVSWSTSGVYGNMERELPIREDAQVAPIEEYSRTKVRQDAVVLRYNHEEGLPTSIVRPGLVYGPRAQYGTMQIFEGLSILPVVPLPGNFDFRMGTVHVRDIAGAAVYIAEHHDAMGQIFGVVDSSGVTMSDFLRMVAEEHGAKVIPIEIPPMLAREAGLAAAAVAEWLSKNITHKRPAVERDPVTYFPVDLHISNQKLLDLGYQFEYDDVRSGIRNTIEWMKRDGIMGLKMLRRYF